MDFTAGNTALWGVFIQIGIIAGILLAANILRRKLSIVRRTLLPVSVLGGFLLLLIRLSGFIVIDARLLEMITYHGIAIGFIALSLRTREAGGPRDSLTAPKSGALIVSCYLLQGIAGLAITLGLAYTIMPDLFKAAGILLPMGYGQGPGPANNIGAAYENLGFAGGRSFALSIAASGFLAACIAGIIYLNILFRKGVISKKEGNAISGSITTEVLQDADELPLSESVDRFSINLAMVLLTYLITYLCLRFLSFIACRAGAGVEKTVVPLLWGFNFIVGSLAAMLVRVFLGRLRRIKVMNHQYQNNYLLSRISGLAFDVMIISGIAGIDVSGLRSLWLPFILLSAAGTFFTLFYLKWICRKLYPGYYLEGMMSLYGMMTGTISSGILLLRELDPQYETPAAGNLISGSAFAILFGFPMLALIGIAPGSPLLTFVVLGLLIVYFFLLLIFILMAKPRRNVSE
ncbi:MAG: sodium:glutamate symporter [Treponema sp.]|nr:sodium:glutamate symporter [Treponema sp.]